MSLERLLLRQLLERRRVHLHQLVARPIVKRIEGLMNEAKMRRVSAGVWEPTEETVAWVDEAMARHGDAIEQAARC